MRKTVTDFGLMKKEGRKIVMLTAYDASMARMLDRSGVVDLLLVGDSLGMVMLGYDSTVPVTMEEMLHHAKAVRRGAPEAFIVGDMPFGAYQTGERDAIFNALRFLKEAGCDAIKLEGGLAMCGIVKSLVEAGIPVMAHIGLTPQTAGQLGGYKVQGKGLDAAGKLLAEARGLEAAGAFAVVMECIPAGLAQVISRAVAIPTIGIGAGVHCDGQVLVTHDLLGMFDRFIPKFVKKYSNISPVIQESIQSYGADVKAGAFPGPEHGFADQGDYSSLLTDA